MAGKYSLYIISKKAGIIIKTSKFYITKIERSIRKERSIMLREDKLNREIMIKFSALTEENRALILEILVKSLSEQGAFSFDRLSSSEADP